MISVEITKYIPKNYYYYYYYYINSLEVIYVSYIGQNLWHGLNFIINYSLAIVVQILSQISNFFLFGQISNLCSINKRKT